MYVFAKTSGVVHHDGIGYRLSAGQPWRADDPLVRAHPEAFSDEPLPEHVGSSATPVPSWLRTEQATRAPGEARTAHRGR